MVKTKRIVVDGRERGPTALQWRRQSSHNGAMDAQSPTIVAAGYPEMWQPVHDRYRMFFQCAAKLQPIVSEMIRQPVHGQLLHIVGRMTAAAANTYGALLTLVLNGF